MTDDLHNSSGFVFIINNIHVTGALPTELIKNHVFRSATDREIEVIEKQLKGSLGHLLSMWRNPYNTEPQTQKIGTSTSTTWVLQPKRKWRYWVIAFEGLSDELGKLEQASQLLKSDIAFGFQVGFNQPSQGGPPRTFTMPRSELISTHFASEVNRADPKKITRKELIRIGEIYNSFQALDKNPDYAFISHAIANYASIRTLPKYAELRIVAYFSVIESLITHAPRLTETLDSISHQIKHKMILLRKMFERHIKQETFFDNARTVKEEKLWNCLYRYRSCIAHGTTPNFEGELQMLKDRPTVDSFLKENIKELLLVAIQNPELIQDLKRC